jgi:hypothetical protein
MSRKRKAAARVFRLGFSRYWQGLFEGIRLKIPVDHPGDAVVHVNGVAVAKQLFAPFLDPHVRFLPAINHKVVDFVDRFIEYPGGLENRLVVHTDAQGAAKLVEIEFDEMSFRGSHFQGKFHKSFVLFKHLKDAILVPFIRRISPVRHPGIARRCVLHPPSEFPQIQGELEQN